MDPRKKGRSMIKLRSPVLEPFSNRLKDVGNHIMTRMGEKIPKPLQVKPHEGKREKSTSPS